jgi:hypothetical protein
MVNLSEIKFELEVIEHLKGVVRARSMVYQVEAKERAARKRGLPLDTYYDLPYMIWAEIRDSGG